MTDNKYKPIIFISGNRDNNISYITIRKNSCLKKNSFLTCVLYRYKRRSYTSSFYSPYRNIKKRSFYFPLYFMRRHSFMFKYNPKQDNTHHTLVFKLRSIRKKLIAVIKERSCSKLLKPHIVSKALVKSFILQIKKLVYYRLYYDIVYRQVLNLRWLSIITT